MRAGVLLDRAEVRPELPRRRLAARGREGGVDAREERLAARAHQGGDERLPVLEVVVERAHRDAGVGGDRLHARREAVRGEHVLGGRQDRARGLLAQALAQPRVGRGGGSALKVRSSG